MNLTNLVQIKVYFLKKKFWDCLGYTFVVRCWYSGGKKKKDVSAPVSKVWAVLKLRVSELALIKLEPCGSRVEET